MKVFISWSGTKSQQVAIVLREWLPSVIQSIQPYVSSEDIDKGTRWSTDIAKELADSTFGILCVTKDNLEAPWLSFEAGALSKTMDKACVTPFLFDIKRSEVKGPLLQFQSTIFQKEDLKKLVGTLNKASESQLSDDRLSETFEVWYQKLEEKLNTIKGEPEQADENKKKEGRTVHSSELIEEILDLSRNNQLLLRTTESRISENRTDVSVSIEELKKILQNQSESLERLSRRQDRRRMSMRNSMLFEEIVHVMPRNPYSFPYLISPLKSDFPWIYDSGIAVFNKILSSKTDKEKEQAYISFMEFIDFVTGHPLLKDMCGDNPDIIILLRRYLPAISGYLKETMSIH